MLGSDVATACQACASQMAYWPGTTSLRCISCGSARDFGPDATGKLGFQDFLTWQPPQPTPGSHLARSCPNCHAQVAPGPLSEPCPYCSSHLVDSQTAALDTAPDAVVPFKIDRTAAGELLREWTRKKRFFAISSFEGERGAESLVAAYQPIWVLKGRSTTQFTGRKGKERTVNSRTETTWTDVDGTLSTNHDKTIVPAGVHDEQTGSMMRNAELGESVAFRPQYLAGFISQPITTSVAQAFEAKRDRFTRQVESDVEDKIGGDHQEITSLQTTYDRLNFRLVLIPVWVLTYMFEGKAWHAWIDGSDGYIRVDYPISKFKTRLTQGLVIAAILAVPVLFFGLPILLGR